MGISLEHRMPIALLREAAKAKREAAEAYQLENTVMVQGVRLRPAIGKTGGSPNVGWEMHKKDSADWYVSNKEEALGKLGKYLAH